MVIIIMSSLQNELCKLISEYENKTKYFCICEFLIVLLDFIIPYAAEFFWVYDICMVEIL